MFNWDEFRNGKVAVNCDTEEKAKEFLKECYERKLKWFDGSLDTCWKINKENTCYEYIGKLVYCSKSHYEEKEEGYKIIKWESENMKFKVGDKIRAIDDRYTFTNKENGFIGEVVELIDETSPIEYKDLMVKELDGSLTYKVNSRHFELIEPQTEFTFQEVIARNIPGTYVNKGCERIESVEIDEDGSLTIKADFSGLNELGLGLGVDETIKFKLQEPKKMYVLYGIEHQENGKIYFFRSRQNRVILDTALVICDTSKGKSYGRAVQRVEKELTESEYKQYKECWRA